MNKGETKDISSLSDAETATAVAELVMGWEKRREYVQDPLTHGEEEKDIWVGEDISKGGWLVAKWNPCQKWEHTGLVIERMHGIGWHLDLKWYFPAEVARAVFQKGDLLGIGMATISPLKAICEAALGAVRKERGAGA